jgi:hypothetical protein
MNAEEGGALAAGQPADILLPTGMRSTTIACVRISIRSICSRVPPRVISTS